MKENQEGFFTKMKNAEQSGFEITMFAISVVVALVVLISVIWLAIFWNRASSNKITDEEADASSVTESAVAVETEEPTPTPYGAAIINDDNIIDEDDTDAIDEDLAKSKYGYTTAVVNMRSAASLTASVVTKVPLHTRVKFIKLHDKEWMEVTYNGMKGFINAMYLSVTKPAAVVAPTIQPARTPAPTKTPKPTKKPTKTPKPTKKPPKTPKPTKTPVPTAEPTAVPTEKPTESPTKPPAETENPQEKTE